MNTIFNLEKMLEFFSTVFYFLMTNILFILSNIPFIFFFLFVGITQTSTYLPLFLVCLIPTGPALAALFYSMHKYISYKDTTICHHWFKGYKMNFKTAFLVGIIQLLTVFIVLTNIRTFTAIYPLLPLRVFFTILFYIVVLSIPYAYLLIMRFHLSVINVIKLSLTLVFTHPVLSICNVMIFFFALMLFELSAGTTVLFISTIYAFCLLISNRHLIKKIEDMAHK